MDSFPFRAWINQPSTLQPLHKEHGRLVIVVKKDYLDYLLVCPIQGPCETMSVPALALSKGWPDHLRKEDR